jgi:CubicO group peptidase (beta-lactamase class C family)/peptidoglycan/LPS O-acetylase OafA/YrhL
MHVATTDIRPRADNDVAQHPHRDPFLDTVRAVAIVRVVLWHATGAALVTYLVAAVPALVFVTGSLLTRSLMRRRWHTVLADRYRRLMIPYWVFAAAAFAAMVVAHVVRTDDTTDLPSHALFTWLVPVVDPVGSEWQEGWLTSPLWFIRLMVWLIALSPLLVWAARRAAVASLALLAALTVLIDLAARGDWSATVARAFWYAGDLTMFAGFFVLGGLYGTGRLVLRVQTLLTIAAVCAGGAAVWYATQPVPDNVVNNSHPMHLLVGLGWLSLALAAKPWVVRAAETPAVATVVRAITRRSLTIYLWHSVAVVAGYRIVDGIGDLPQAVEWGIVLACTAVLTAAIVQLLGWVEDVAAQRRAQRQWSPLGLAGIATGVALVAAAVWLPNTQSTVALPQAPSGQPIAPVWETGDTSVPATSAPPGAPSTNAPQGGSADTALQAVVDDYAARTGTGIAVRVIGPATDFSAATGTSSDGRTLDLDSPFVIQSVTKMVTAVLVWQQIDAGALQLDGSFPVPGDLQGFGLEQLTVRDLLAHQSGISEYREPLGPVSESTTTTDAMLAALNAPAAFDSGSQRFYSSTNYMILGEVLEEVTGRSYEELVADLADDAGIDSMQMRQDLEGRIAWSSGGIEMSVDDLGTLAGAVFTTDQIITASTRDAYIADVDPTSTLGPGVNAFCPCVQNPEGTPSFHSYGHFSATTRVAYVPETNVVVVIQFDGTRGLSKEFNDDAVALTADLAAAATR